MRGGGACISKQHVRVENEPAPTEPAMPVEEAGTPVAEAPGAEDVDESSPLNVVNVVRPSWGGQLFVRTEGKTRVLHNVASHYSVPLCLIPVYLSAPLFL